MLTQKKAKPWRCPTCRREFPKRGQTHSCANFPVSAHFAGKSAAVRRLFQTLRKRVTSLGRVRIGSVRTEITFQNRFHFAACQVKPRHLVLYLPVGRELDSRRFGKPVQIGRNKFLYTVRLSTPGDVDEQVVSLLRQAHHNAS